MSVELRLDAETRSEQGKGASRRLRRAKKLPAILYGADQPPVSLTLSEEQVLRLMRDETFFSQIIDLRVDGRSERVILKDLQRHPFKPLVSHMDLLRVRAGQKLRQTVPIHFLNEETAKGVKAGGVIHHDMNEVEVECLPDDLPTYIEVDIAGLELDSAMHLSEIAPPPGAVFVALETDPEHDPTLVSIHTPRVVEEEEPEEGEEGEEAQREVPTVDESEEEDKD